MLDTRRRPAGSRFPVAIAQSVPHSLGSYNQDEGTGRGAYTAWA